MTKIYLDKKDDYTNMVKVYLSMYGTISIWYNDGLLRL